MTQILIPVIIVAAIGLIAGLGLAIASIVFAVPVDEKAERIAELMVYFREKGKMLFEGEYETVDYSKGIADLPIENVLRFVWIDGSWVAVRPSGTEPKIKVYYSVRDESKEMAKERHGKLKAVIDSIIL